MHGATGVTLQPQQILRLPRRKIRILNPRHIYNIIYHARSNSYHDRTSYNPQPASQARLLFELTTSIFYLKNNVLRLGFHAKMHQVLHLP